VHAEPIVYFYSVGWFLIGLAALVVLLLVGWLVVKN
jgi:hypothetical protein